MKGQWAMARRWGLAGANQRRELSGKPSRGRGLRSPSAPVRSTEVTAEPATSVARRWEFTALGGSRPGHQNDAVVETLLSEPSGGTRRVREGAPRAEDGGWWHRWSTADLKTRWPWHTVLMVLLACVVLAPGVRAQEGPVGNAHPQAEAVAGEGAPPFGEPRALGEVDEASIGAKVEFATSVDLSPLRDLAVQHGGRVKILDTLARETVSEITGRGRFAVAAGGRKHSFDPLFTLLDLVIDPAFYAHEPVIHVEYLPLRREYVRRALPVPPTATPEEAAAIEAQRENLLKATRITPLMALSLSGPIADDYATSQPYLEGLGKVQRAMRLWRDSGGNMLLVAPPGEDQRWIHLRGSYPRWREVHAVADELGEAWRARDAAGVEVAAARLAEILPTIHPEVYPRGRRGLELAYNELDAFTWGYWLYFFAMVLLLVAMGTGRRWVVWAGLAVLLAAVGMHLAGFLARCVIAERWAIQNQFESMTGVSLFGSLLALGLMAWRRQLFFGAAAAAMGFLVLITATEASIPGQTIGREAAILNTSVLLKYHVTTVLTSYGLITLGFVLSLFYLGTLYGGRLRGWLGEKREAAEAVRLGRAGALADAPDADSAGGRGSQSGAAGSVGSEGGATQVLRDLDRATMIVLQLAFWTLGVGILLGAWWADHSWGRWWAFDPKETWALATWIIYLIVIHVRLVASNRELVTAWLSVLGFVVMLWTYFGVNLLLSGLHSYA